MSPPTTDRAALEAELRPAELRCLQEWCLVWSEDVEGWPEVARLGAFVDLALGRFLGRLPSYWPPHRRLCEAAEHFGIALPGLRKRYQRADVVPGAVQVTRQGIAVDLAAERRAARERRAG